MAAAITNNETIPGQYEELHADGTLVVAANTWALYYEHRPATYHSVPSPSGWRAPLPWSHERSVTVEPEMSATISQPWSHATGSGNADNWMRAWFRLYPSVGTLEDLAVNQVLLNLSNQKADFGQDYAERQQTIDMVADRAKGIGRSIRRFKDSHPKDWRKVKKLTFYGKKAAGAIPLRWLELNYGWIPAMLDVKGAMDVLKKRDSAGDSLRYSAKASRHVASSWLSPSPNGWRGMTGNGSKFTTPGEARCLVNDFAGVFVRVDFTMDNPALHEIQQLGLVNPVALAWNLVPYSFVADWFLPVGSYLQSWTAALGLRFLGGSVSVLQKRSINGLVATRVDSGSGYQIFEAHGGRVDNVKFNRTVLTSFPGPRMPHFKNPLTLGHFANAMSLLVSALR